MLQAELIAAQTPPRTIARAVMADAGKAGAVGAGGGRGGISEARRSIPSERMEETVCEVWRPIWRSTQTTNFHEREAGEKT
jgi:hypothetical protein